MSRGIFETHEPTAMVRASSNTVSPASVYNMSDSDSSEKKPAAPSWQTELKNSTPTEGDSETQSPNRESLIDQAKKFLEEDEVRNASTDKKISFLESKGLNNEEIQSLIGITRQADASGPAPSTVSWIETPRQLHTLITFAGFSYISTTSINILLSFSSSAAEYASSNHLSRIPHHARPAHTSRHHVPPPHHPLPFRWPLCPPLWHQQLPHNPHGRLFDRIPPLPRLHHLFQPLQTDLETRNYRLRTPAPETPRRRRLASIQGRRRGEY